MVVQVVYLSLCCHVCMYVHTSFYHIVRRCRGTPFPPLCWLKNCIFLFSFPWEVDESRVTYLREKKQGRSGRGTFLAVN